MKWKRRLASTAIFLTASMMLAASPANAESASKAGGALDQLERVLESRAGNGQLKSLSARTDAGGATLTNRGIRVDSATGQSLEIRFRDEAVKASAAGRGNLSVFGSSDDDYNFATGETEGRIAGYTIINSAESKSSFDYEILVNDQPAHLAAHPDGSVSVQTPEGGLSNIVSPAWAVDAAGKSLSTFYTIDGNILTQHVNFKGALFPVVADPQMACDYFHCTLEFNKSETKTIAENGWQASGVVAGACSKFGIVVAAACGALGGGLTITAAQAKNQDDCVGVRSAKDMWGLATGVPYPVIYDGSNCR